MLTNVERGNGKKVYQCKFHTKSLRTTGRGCRMQAKDKLGKNMQIEPKKFMLRKNSPNPTSPPTLASSIAIFIYLLVFNAVIIIFPAKTIDHFL